MKLTLTQLVLLMRVDEMLNSSDLVKAVYTEPSQALRDQADKMDWEDKLKKDLKQLVKELSVQGEIIDQINSEERDTIN